MKILQRVLLVAVILAAIAPTRGDAQPAFNFRRIVNNWPIIELYFTVGCGGAPAYTMGLQNFEVYESGLPMKPLRLWCPDPNYKCPVSVAIVLDESGSIMGDAHREIQLRANEFVNALDGVTDEACVIAFANHPNLRQGMTTNQTRLHNAINSTVAADSSCVWDAIYYGINQLIQNATNPCMAVVVITDGEDNFSREIPKTIIRLANRNRLRIYTMGVGNLVGQADLVEIANSTGGRYIDSRIGDDMGSIYQDMTYTQQKGYLECRVEYDATCGDGSKRYVDLLLKDFCGGSDKRSKTYFSTLDSTTYTDLHFSLGDATIKANQEVTIPLTVDDWLNNEILYPATFTITVDNPGCVRFKKLTTPPGSLLQGMPITVTPSGNTITIQTGKRTITGSGTLAELVFQTGDPNDPCCSDIRLSNWTFDQGCRLPVLKNGKICVIPQKPVVQCVNTAPTHLTWDPIAKDYTPNPFNVSIQVQNIGDKDAKNARFRIIYNPADLVLFGPTTDVQIGKPPDVLQGGGVLDVSWNMKARLRNSAKEVEVCIVASFDNHPDVICCSKIQIPASGPIISCELTSPPIKPDKALQRYTPMPFDVTLTMRNDGGSRTDTVWATIIVPPDLVLSGPDSPNKHTKRVAITVLPGNQASVKWEVKHPITIVPVDYTVVVWVKTSNADSTFCEKLIQIPALDAPVLKPECHAPDSLHFDDPTNTYLPDPFDVSVECRNIGGLTAEQVTAFLYLPANVVLANPTDSLRKTFAPSTMHPYKPGEPVSRLTWRVRYTKKLRYDTQLDFKFVVGGMTTLGIRTDSTDTWCTVRVPGLAPAFDCSLSLPDSCIANPVGNDVTPNPVTVEYRVWNTSKLAARIATAQIAWPAGLGLQLDPPTQAINKVVNRTLDPGDTLLLTWTFKIENRITRRDVSFNVIAIDEDGSPVRACGGHLVIANLKTALVCNLQSTANVLNYGQGNPGYTPSTFVITGTLTNTGGAPLHDSWARIEMQDPLDLIEFDPGYIDPDYASNDTSRVYGYLEVGKSKSASWGFRLKQANRTDSSQFVTFDLRYKSTETPEMAGACSQVIEIKPVKTSKLACALIAPDTIRFVDRQYIPTPVDLRVRIENQSSGDALNVHAFVLQSTRFTVIPPSYFTIDTMRAGETREPFSTPGFRLLTNPRATDGFDTIRVAIAADGIPSTLCEYPVYVLHEQRPTLALTCSVTPSTLTFDDQLGDYTPNPFTVTTVASNRGETRAEQCQVSFIGPPRFTLERSSPIEVLGVLDPGATMSTAWAVRALCHQVEGWDTLYFQIQGRGGLDNALRTDTCRALVYVPACRTAEYTIRCSQQRSFTFDANAGVYQPVSVTISDTVTNTGLADGIGLEATLTAPAGLYLVSGDSPTKPLPNLKAGQSAVVAWNLSPIARANDTTLKVPVTLTDRRGSTLQCANATVTVPRASTFALMCEPSTDPARFPDTLVVDKANGVYMGGPIFPAAITVSNVGQRPLDSVYVLMIAESPDVVIESPPLVLASVRLDPGATVPVQWQWSCKPRLVSSDVAFRFIISARSSVSSECVKSVFIPLIGRPTLDILFTTIPADTLHFDRVLADYEGTKSAFGDYNVFTVTARVQNIGAAQADSLRATLLPPNGVTLDEGEAAIRHFTPYSVPVNGQGTVSWKLRPKLQIQGALRTFTIDIESHNAGKVRLTTPLFIQGAPLEATLWIPEDNVGRFGDVITIPLNIGPTIGRDIFAYRANVAYDPAVIKFRGADNANTMTEVGWNALKVTEFPPPTPGDRAVVRIEDMTPGSLIYRREPGTLVNLSFECMYNTDRMAFVQSPLDIIDFTPVGHVVPLISSLNSTSDTEPGGVAALRQSGRVTVSGECITPLQAGLTYQLKQNTPNPFNPVTSIEYEIPETTPVTLRIFDQLGREVRTYVRGVQKAGRYTLQVDASTLPSGVYTYTLETPSFTRSMRMILAR